MYNSYKTFASELLEILEEIIRFLRTRSRAMYLAFICHNCVILLGRPKLNVEIIEPMLNNIEPWTAALCSSDIGSKRHFNLFDISNTKIRHCHTVHKTYIQETYFIILRRTWRYSNLFFFQGHDDVQRHSLFSVSTSEPASQSDDSRLCWLLVL